MKLFIDTNLWIRYILKDIPKQSRDVEDLLVANEEGLLQLYTSSIILLEICYVLKAVYKFQFEEIIDVIDSILKTKNITVIEETDFPSAFKLFRINRLKISDSLIATQLKKDMTLVTFDKDFEKIKDIHVNNPSQALSLLKN